jgi:UDP-N-acetylmuramoyl-tripeptide--D-alanyl-D-alanine ligase
MRQILQWVLFKISRLMIKRHRPEIIGITGSVGKSSTKQAIATVLATQFTVRTNINNYNNEKYLNDF